MEVFLLQLLLLIYLLLFLDEHAGVDQQANMQGACLIYCYFRFSVYSFVLFDLVLNLIWVL